MAWTAALLYLRGKSFSGNLPLLWSLVLLMDGLRQPPPLGLMLLWRLLCHIHSVSGLMWVSITNFMTRAFFTLIILAWHLIGCSLYWRELFRHHVYEFAKLVFFCGMAFADEVCFLPFSTAQHERGMDEESEKLARILWDYLRLHHRLEKVWTILWHKHLFTRLYNAYEICN